MAQMFYLKVLHNFKQGTTHLNFFTVPHKLCTVSELLASALTLKSLAFLNSGPSFYSQNCSELTFCGLWECGMELFASLHLRKKPFSPGPLGHQPKLETTEFWELSECLWSIPRGPLWSSLSPGGPSFSQVLILPSLPWPLFLCCTTDHPNPVLFFPPPFTFCETLLQASESNYSLMILAFNLITIK